MRKLALLAFVTVAFVACNKAPETTPVVDTTAVVAAPDTTKKDTAVKADSATKDTAVKDDSGKER